jgi:NADPH-dependent 2,4-dienoyl-CoA reductase/sulfur reductase-like enzyme/rhodanese-related sulfurtransferase
MSKAKTVVIVGGVAGGASAAVRLRRLDEQAEIILFERGPNVSFANCGLPYYIGGEIQDRPKLLVQTSQSLHKRFRLDVRVRHEVLSIHRDKKTVTVRDLEKGTEFEQHYDALVLSPGASPVQPPIPGIKLPGAHCLRTLADMDAIKAEVDSKPKGRVLVVGAGFIGLEMVESFARRGWEVLLVEMASQVLAPTDPEMAVTISRELEAQGVQLALQSQLKGIRESGDGALLADLEGVSERVNMVLLSVGVRPDVQLAVDAGLELGNRRGIKVDPHMRTNDPHIYAVGDAVESKDVVSGQEVLVPLAGPANRQGRIAADNIAGIPSVFRGTQGTAIVRVFDIVFAMTGASEKLLKSQGKRYEKIYLHPPSHAGYYPGAAPMRLKVLFDPQDGKLLGAQASGAGGVDKFMDVMATALQAGFTVHDLEEMELTYAPPFGSAKSPANFAGFIAENIRSGRVGVFHCEEAFVPKTDQMLLDVRTPNEFSEGSIPGAVNIPVDDLRERMGEISKNKEILVFCRGGLRGYVASRILSQAGFRARNLSGGWLTWEAWRESKKILGL